MAIQLEPLSAATSTSPKISLGPSEPRLEIEEEVETDSPTHSLIQPKEEGFLPEEGVIELTPLNPIPGRGGEGEEEIDAATQQLAVIPKKEEFVLEKEIIDAIELGEEATVKEWLEKEETKVNDWKGGEHAHGHFSVSNGTALHWAAYFGQPEIAKLLIDKGADPRVRATGEETVLHWACQCYKEDEELLKLLLSTSTETSDKRLVDLVDCNGWTPLHYACFDNNEKLIKQLLNAGADPWARDYDYSTPLHLLDEEEMADLLDKDRLLPRSNNLELGDHIIEAMRMEKKETPERKEEKEKKIKQWLDRESEDVNRYRGGYATEGGFEVEDGTALHWAAYYGNYHATELLIEKGADPRVLNTAMENALHWACKSEEENEELVEKFLLPRLKQKPIDVNFADEEGYTALHYACWRGHQKIVEKLLEAEADKSARNRFGETPVESAFKSGKNEVVELVDRDGLLPRANDPKLPNYIMEAIKSGNKSAVQKWLQRKKPDVNRCRGGELGGTALHWAALYGKCEIAQHLLKEENAKSHVMDKAGETVLHWACRCEQDNDEMVDILLEIMPERQVNSTNSKGCTALHHACSKGHQKVVAKLLNHNADPSAMSSAGYTPLDFAFVVAGDKGKDVVKMLDSDHYLLPRDTDPPLEEEIIEAIEKGDNAVVERWLKREGQNLNHLRGGTSWSFTTQFYHANGTALHWAAYYGQLDIAKLLIDSGANPRAKATDNGTVLHWACSSENENKELVQLLLQKMYSMQQKKCKIDARDAVGNTPIHLAALVGHQRIVEDLIDRDRACVKYRIMKPMEAVQEKDDGGRTPLLCASIEGHHNVVKLLMKEGAKVELQDLQAAIQEGNEQVVSDLLQSPQWPTLLRQGWRNTTPFRELIKKMPEIAKQVLDRCVVSDPRTRDPKHKEFKVLFDYSFVEDHRDEHASYETEVTKVYPEDKRKAHEMRFTEVKEQKQKNFTTSTSYGPLFEKSNHPLAIMVQHKRLNLLNHPVIRSLLHHKWFRFGLWGYLLNLLIYVIFTVILTIFALNLSNPQSTTCMQVLSNPQIAVCEQMEGINSTGEFTAGNGSGMMENDTAGMIGNDTTREQNGTCIRCELSDTSPLFLFTAAIIIIVLAAIRLLLEASQLMYQHINYLFDWVNWIEVSLYILSIIFVSVFRTTCLCPQVWQWQIGVMAILLAWIDLIIICAKFPNIGLYVIMFGKIFGTFLKVILLSTLLVATFGLTFYMTFSEPQYQRSPFSPPATAMLKIISMTAGDFNFDTVFRKSPSGEIEHAQEIQFPPISYILWIIFVILMPILFTNMLLGLAVGDIQQIKKDADLKKLAFQVELILTTEDLLRSIGWHRRFITGRKKIKPNFKSTTKSELAMEMENFNTCEKVIVRLIVWIYFGFKEFSYQLWGGQRYDTLEIIQETLNSNLDFESKDDIQKEQVEVPEMMKQMRSQMDSEFKKISECMQALEKLIKKANANKGGSDSKRESEEEEDSDESDSNN